MEGLQGNQVLSYMRLCENSEILLSGGNFLHLACNSEGIDQAASEDFDLGAQDGHILSDDRSVERVRRRQGGATPRRVTLDGVIKAVCRAYRLEEATLRGSGRRRRPAKARAMVAWLIRDLAGVSLTKAATRLSRDISSLSAATTRLEQRAKGDRALAQRHRKLWDALQ